MFVKQPAKDSPVSCSYLVLKAETNGTFNGPRMRALFADFGLRVGVSTEQVVSTRRRHPDPKGGDLKADWHPLAHRFGELQVVISDDHLVRY